MTNTASSTALLVMDIHIMHRLGDTTAVTASLHTAIAVARSAGLPIIYIVVAFRKGHPEINPDNKSFSALRQNAAAFSGLEEPVVFPEPLAPQPGDIVVTKRRISAFSGSDLEVILRSLHVGHMVLTGFATGGVVLSTLREAADKDYKITVLSDCCGDMDPEVHQVLLNKVFPRQSDVVTAQAWAAALK